MKNFIKFGLFKNIINSLITKLILPTQDNLEEQDEKIYKNEKSMEKFYSTLTVNIQTNKQTNKKNCGKAVYFIFAINF